MVCNEWTFVENDQKNIVTLECYHPIKKKEK